MKTIHFIFFSQYDFVVGRFSYQRLSALLTMEWMGKYRTSFLQVKVNSSFVFDFFCLKIEFSCEDNDSAITLKIIIVLLLM